MYFKYQYIKRVNLGISGKLLLTVGFKKLFFINFLNN
jgi:hypothetical protein